MIERRGRRGASGLPAQLCQSVGHAAFLLVRLAKATTRRQGGDGSSRVQSAPVRREVTRSH